MSLRHFLNAAYAIFVETYERVPGKTLFDAIDLTNESIGIETSPNIPIEAQNEMSLKQLEAQLMGLG